MNVTAGLAMQDPALPSRDKFLPMLQKNVSSLYSLLENVMDLARLQALVADGLVSVDATRLEATDRGRLLLRIIAACFDRYLHQAAGQPGARATGDERDAEPLAVREQ